MDSIPKLLSILLWMTLVNKLQKSALFGQVLDAKTISTFYTVRSTWIRKQSIRKSTLKFLWTIHRFLLLYKYDSTYGRWSRSEHGASTWCSQCQRSETRLLRSCWRVTQPEPFCISHSDDSCAYKAHIHRLLKTHRMQWVCSCRTWLHCWCVGKSGGSSGNSFMNYVYLII